MASFAHELDALIAKHLGTPNWADDLLPVATALHAAAERIDAEADCYGWPDETKQDLEQRRDRWSRLISLEQLIWRDEVRPR